MFEVEEVASVGTVAGVATWLAALRADDRVTLGDMRKKYHPVDQSE